MIKMTAQRMINSLYTARLYVTMVTAMMSGVVVEASPVHKAKP